jgi:hypothetical protein
MRLTRTDQQTLLEQLSAMPAFLDKAFGGLSTAEAKTQGADGFSPVEQCWHLADLERDDYAVRPGRRSRCASAVTSSRRARRSSNTSRASIPAWAQSTLYGRSPEYRHPSCGSPSG